MKVKASVILLLAGVALLFGACGKKRQESAAQEYPVARVASEAVEVTNDYPATIRGRQDIEIYPQVSGKIVKVAVTEGQRVSRGQTLFVIDQVAIPRGTAQRRGQCPCGTGRCGYRPADVHRQA